MRFAMKNSAALLAAGLTALAGAGAALAQQPIVIKFSHVVSPSAPKGKAAEKFKELAEKYTAGKVKVEVYPNSQLYKDKEELEALQLGAVQLLAPSTAKFAPLGYREYEALDLPYMFADYASYKQFAGSKLGKEMMDEIGAKGVKGLAYWDNGFYIFATKKPVKTPDDFKGLKLRIQGSRVLDAQTRALGAIPQVMAFSEVYQALQTGVVDGLENVPSNIYTQKFYEVAPYITVSNHGHLGYLLVTNKKFWDGLPADVRPALDKAAAEATEFFNAIAKKDNEDGLEAIKATGKATIHMLTDAEKALWVKALLPVHDQMKGRVGKGVVENVQAASGFKAPK